jgi:hypothetical protein
MARFGQAPEYAVAQLHEYLLPKAVVIPPPLAPLLDQAPHAQQGQVTARYRRRPATCLRQGGHDLFPVVAQRQDDVKAKFVRQERERPS